MGPRPPQETLATVNTEDTEPTENTRKETAGYFDEVYRVVRSIPRGRVCTYGKVAELTGSPAAVRAVGWALSALKGPDSGVPWHRVINAQGRISQRGENVCLLQRKLLQSEGVRFSRDGRVDLKKYGWPGL